MERLGAAVLLLLTLVGVSRTVGALETPPPAVTLAFPPFDGKFTCSVDPDDGVMELEHVCTTPNQGQDTALLWSYDNFVIASRFQSRQPVQLWRRNSVYVASFTAYFTINFDRSSEFTVRELFSGGGLAFAITPTLSVVGSGPGQSFGLFPIDEKTGASLNGAKTKTVAVELDISRDTNSGFDVQVPHIGLDINSMKSVQTKYLGDPATVIDVKIGVWVDYNALTKTIKVYTHKVKATMTPRRQNANIAISYVGLDLAKEVNEYSYVGFSSRIPKTTRGVYTIYDFKFSTTWVAGNTFNT